MTDTAPKTPDSELVDEMLTAYYGAHPSLACVQRNKRHMQAAARVLLERMKRHLTDLTDNDEHWVDFAIDSFAREHNLGREGSGE